MNTARALISALSDLAIAFRAEDQNLTPDGSLHLIPYVSKHQTTHERKALICIEVKATKRRIRHNRRREGEHK
jgi:hypothetical protein